MKKQAKPGKMTKAPKTVDEYLSTWSEPSRSALQRVRTIVRDVIPLEATEVISYGISTFKYNGVLMSFAAFSHHCSLFPGAGPIEEFQKDLKNFKNSERHHPVRPREASTLESSEKAGKGATC